MAQELIELCNDLSESFVDFVVVPFVANARQRRYYKKCLKYLLSGILEAILLLFFLPFVSPPLMLTDFKNYLRDSKSGNGKCSDVLKFFGQAIMELIPLLGLVYVGVSTVLYAIRLESFWSVWSLLYLSARLRFLYFFFGYAKHDYGYSGRQFLQGFVAFIGAWSLYWNQLPKTHGDDFVERSGLSEKIQDILSEEYRLFHENKVLVVYGPRGYGKTSLIHNTLKGRRGTVAIELDLPTKTTRRAYRFDVLNEVNRKIINSITFPFDYFKRFVERVVTRERTMSLYAIMNWLTSTCPITPVVFIPVGPDALGEELAKILLFYKLNRQALPAIYIIEVSSMRTFFDMYCELEPNWIRHFTLLHVGPLTRSEATLYITQKLSSPSLMSSPSLIETVLRLIKYMTRKPSNNFVDDPSLAEIALTLILNGFDHNLVTIRNVCKVLEETHLTGVEQVRAIIHRCQLKETMDAEETWNHFRSVVKEKLDRRLWNASVINRGFLEVADLLLQKERQNLLSDTSLSSILRRDEWYDIIFSSVQVSEDQQHPRQLFSIHVSSDRDLGSVTSIFQFSIEDRRAMREVLLNYMRMEGVYGMYRNHGLRLNEMRRSDFTDQLSIDAA